MSASTRNTQAIRGLIGVVHLVAMPGDPRHRGGTFDDVFDAAMRDVRSLVDGGIDGIIVENLGSAPFPKGDASARTLPHHAAMIGRVARASRALFEGALGVNCLRNDGITALGIAAATGADFVRVNVHIGAYVTDQGLIEGEAFETLRYRQSLGTDTAILADVLVKHAQPLVPISIQQAVDDTLKRGMASGVIVSGRATGAPAAPDEVRAVRVAAGSAPVFLGSGFSIDSVDDLAQHLDGAIVGTWLKHDGLLGNPIDPKRVRELASACTGRFFRSGDQ